MMNRAISLHVRTRTAIRIALDREAGASMVEYALLLALIAMIALAAVSLVGEALNNKYDSIASSVVEA